MRPTLSFCFIRTEVNSRLKDEDFSLDLSLNAECQKWIPLRTLQKNYFIIEQNKSANLPLNVLSICYLAHPQQFHEAILPESLGALSEGKC